jgi:feruloyl esterase
MPSWPTNAPRWTFAESSVREVTLLGKAITRPITAARLPVLYGRMFDRRARNHAGGAALSELFDGQGGARDANRQFNLATTHAAVTFNQAAPRDGPDSPRPRFFPPMIAR